MNIYFYDIQFKEYSRSYVDKNLFDIYAMIIPESGDTFDIYGNYLIFENIGNPYVRFDRKCIYKHRIINKKNYTN